MKKELDAMLQKSFPWLKRPELHKEESWHYLPDYTLYENYGFDNVADGWFQILYDLNKEIGYRFEKAGRPVDIKVEQVKSKWGHLCFYYDTPNDPNPIHAIDGIGGSGIRFYPKTEDGDTLYDDIVKIVQKYEREISIRTCERCGQPGSLRKGSWVYTLCDECYQKYLDAKKK